MTRQNAICALVAAFVATAALIAIIASVSLGGDAASDSSDKNSGDVGLNNVTDTDGETGVPTYSPTILLDTGSINQTLIPFPNTTDVNLTQVPTISPTMSHSMVNETNSSTMAPTIMLIVNDTNSTTNVTANVTDVLLTLTPTMGVMNDTEIDRNSTVPSMTPTFWPTYSPSASPTSSPTINGTNATAPTPSRKGWRP